MDGWRHHSPHPPILSALPADPLTPSPLTSSRGNGEAENMAEVAADTAQPSATAETRAEVATDGEADSAGEGEVVEEREQPQGRGEAGQGQQGVGQEQGAGADQEQGTSAGAGEDAGLGAGEGDAPAGQSGGRDGVNGEDSGEDGEDGGSREETPGKAGDTAEGNNENDGNGRDTGGEQSEGANAEGGEAEAKAGEKAEAQAGAGGVREFHGQEGDSTDGIPASAIKAQVTTGSWTGRKWFQVRARGKSTCTDLTPQANGTTDVGTRHAEALPSRTFLTSLLNRRSCCWALTIGRRPSLCASASRARRIATRSTSTYPRALRWRP